MDGLQVVWLLSVNEVPRLYATKSKPKESEDFRETETKGTKPCARTDLPDMD